jgi:hypothetical protein
MPVTVSVVVDEPPEGFPTGLVLLRCPLRWIRLDSGFHQRQHALHYLIDVQAGGIDEDGVFGRPQRRHHALGITGVAGENLA